MARTARTPKQAPAANAPTAAQEAPVSAQTTPTNTQVATQPPQGLHGGFELAALPKHVAKMGAGTPCAAKLSSVKVKLGAKAYRSTAAHCIAWWGLVDATIKANDGAATYAQLQAAGVPGHFVAYVQRRGGLAAA